MCPELTKLLARREPAAWETGDKDVNHDGAVRRCLHKVDCCVVKAAPVVEGALGGRAEPESSCTDVAESSNLGSEVV